MPDFIPFYRPEDGKIRQHDFLEIAEKYGLPLYIYDGVHIKNQYKILRSAFPTEKLDIHFAMKANNNPEILKFMRGLGCGLDTVSLGEVLIALRAGFKPEEIVFTANGASFKEVEQVVELGVDVTLDSIEFIELWMEKFRDKTVSLRLNPSITAGGVKKISTAYQGSKFGIDMRYMEKIDHYIKQGDLKVKGWHIHLGSDVGNKEAFRKSADILLETAEKYPEHLEFINLGGGYRIPYSPDEKIESIHNLGNELTERFHQLEVKTGKKLKLIIEPGKFLISQAGFLLIETTVVKSSGDKKFAITNSGFSQFMRPMYYNAHHEIYNLSNPDGDKKSYDICGNICEEDNFAVNRLMSEIRVGDTLCICNAGAYGYAMASMYNVRPLPAEIFLTENDYQLIRRRLNAKEFIERMV